MPRNITGNALDSVNQTSGTQPVFVVGINWGFGISYYSNRSFMLDKFQVKGCIITISPISSQRRSDNMGNTSNVSITFDDSDGDFKKISDATLIEKKAIAVYQHFLENSSADVILLFYGKISGPVSWSEENRTLTLSATSELESSEIGVSPTKDDFDDIAPQAEGIPWPLVFGQVKKAPTVQIRKHTQALLASTIRLRSKIYKTISNTGADKQTRPQVLKMVDECDEISINTDEENMIYFEPSDSINFDITKDIQISIDSVIFEGRYDDVNNKFKIKKSNIPMYTNVKLGARDGNDSVEKNRNSKSKSFDPLSGYNVLWLDDDKINLNQKHCYFQTSSDKDWYGFCEAQYGKKCVFKRPFRSPQTGKLFLMTSSQKISQVYSIERCGLENGIGDQLDTLAEQKDYTLVQQILDKAKNSDSGFWSRPSGTKVRLWNQDDPDIYIVSAVELDSVDSVYGKRKVPLENGKEIEVFAQIPSYYYSVQLQSNYQIEGDFVSALLFYTPLEERDDGKWKDQIYVSSTSTVGPNTSDVLKYLLQRFSDYGIDSTSFNTVAAKIDDTPSDFVLFERGDVLKICQEIAWQARCAIIIEEQIIKMRFLAEQATQVMLLDESNIQLKSIEFGFSETIDLVTKLVGTWTADYQDTEAPTRHHERRTAELNEIVRALTEESRSTKSQTRISIFKNNIDQFGVIPSERRFYIYTNEDSVMKSLSFWGHRLSNIWKKVTLKGMLPTILLQEFDTIAFDVTASGLSVLIEGIVESSSYNPVELENQIVLWIPSIAGTLGQSADAYS